jgi:hypothetical protein
LQKGETNCFKDRTCNDNGSTVCKLPYQVDLAAVPFISMFPMPGNTPLLEQAIPRELFLLLCFSAILIFSWLELNPRPLSLIEMRDVRPF